MTINASVEKYAALDQSLGTFKEANRHVGMNLADLVMSCKTTAERDGVPLNQVLKGAFHLKDNKAIEELGAVLETLDRIEKGWYDTKRGIPHIAMHRVYEKGPVRLRKEFELAEGQWVREVADYTKGIAGNAKFPMNVKEMIVYPLMASMYKELKSRELDFLHRFMNAVIDSETANAILRK
jgi:hypothetical protein